MKKVSKGEFGYVKYQKKRRFLITLLMFAIPFLIYFTGIAYFGKKENLMTVIAILGVLPAAKFMVGFIMINLQKSAPESSHRIVESVAGETVHAYELMVTAYEGRMPLDAVVIGNGSVAALSTQGDKSQFDFFQKHIVKCLQVDQIFDITVKLFSDENTFAQRAEQLGKCTRTGQDEKILNTLKAISI